MKSTKYTWSVQQCISYMGDKPTLLLPLVSNKVDHKISSKDCCEVLLGEAQCFRNTTKENHLDCMTVFLEYSGGEVDTETLRQFDDTADNNLAYFNKTANTITLVNSANHRFSDRGGLLNQSINSIVGPELREKSVAHYSDVGVAYKAPLVFTVQLSQQNECGFRTVIQAVAPHLNPNKPFCEPSREAALEALRETYRRIFEEFLAQLRTQQGGRGQQQQQQQHSGDDSPSAKKRPRLSHGGGVSDSSLSGAAAFAVSSNATNKGAAVESSDKNSAVKSTQQTTTSSSSSSSSAKTSGGGCGGVGNSFGFNKNILYEYIRHPGAHSSGIYERHEGVCTVIWDAYPKARRHLLLIPDEHYFGDKEVREVRHLDARHRDKVMQLHGIAREVAGEVHRASLLESSRPAGTMLIGYHAAPSLHPLHVHIVSGDLDSPSLKTKKHWNSFTLDAHFIPIDRVEQWLDRGQSVASQLPSEAELHELVNHTPLRCHKCDAPMTNMPTLKRHILTHM